MSTVEPGWYRDPADTTTQRYWDGGGWIGDPIPADATPPPGPPKNAPAPPPAKTAPPTPAPPTPAAPTPAAPPERLAPAHFEGPATLAGEYAYPYARAGALPRPHGLMLAGVGSRFVARIVDILVVLVLCVVANAWFAIQFWHGFQPAFTEIMRRAAEGNSSAEGLPVLPESTSTLLLMMLVATTAVWFAYEVPSSANSGQTLGKRLLGIKVVRLESEERLGFGRSFRRWSRLGLPTLLWSCCGVGFFLQFVDCLFIVLDRPLRQTIHDKAAATVVVQVPRPGRPETTPISTATSGGRHADPR